MKTSNLLILGGLAIVFYLYTKKKKQNNNYNTLPPQTEPNNQTVDLTDRQQIPLQQNRVEPGITTKEIQLF